MPSQPIPLSEIPTLTLLYKLNHLPPLEEEAVHKPNVKYNDIISLIRHDITALEVSAIVNAANKSLLGGGGVDGAIHARAGPGLLEECEELDGCMTGDAKITGAYELPCEKVIHAVGPIYSIMKRKDPDRPAELLRGCYHKSLKLAVENGCKSIAFSCIGTGVYGYPAREACKVVLETVREWLDDSDKASKMERIIFCCFEKKDEVAYQDFLPLYFPPVEETKNEQSDEKDANALEQRLPDPPTNEPVEEGQPDAKKQKTAATGDEEWEELEKPEGSAVNGVENEEKGQHEGKQADIIVPVESNKQDLTESEVSKPRHGLEKDW